MLKTVSSIVNAIGALNYKGAWNASTNTPALASGVGTKGDYYQVSVAGSTALDGISNWGVGDVVAFNGTTWQRIEDKYNDNPDYRRFACNDEENIDAKINGAYIVMGLLYCEGDIDQTIIVSPRCGQDSDCNPSNAAGVLCTSIGY